jgi:hypothetical protein
VTGPFEKDPYPQSVQAGVKRAVLGLSVGVLRGAVVVAALVAALILLVLSYLDSHGA